MHLSTRSTSAITYKHRSVSDYPSLVRAYSDGALASPFRSTVPLLAYWSALEEKLPDFATALGIKLLEPERFAFEYTVPVQKGRGYDSHTDLMLLLRCQSIAIEAKYTEPKYPIVRDWLGSPSSLNRESVLSGWLNLINRATGVTLEIADVLDCAYQLVHRTASACQPNKQVRVVVYQCFDPSDKQTDYYHDQLSRLSGLIGKPECISFYRFIISLEKSPQYESLQQGWIAGNRNLAAEVRQGLIEQSLLEVGVRSVRRM